MHVRYCKHTIWCQEYITCSQIKYIHVHIYLHAVLLLQMPSILPVPKTAGQGLSQVAKAIATIYGQYHSIKTLTEVRNKLHAKLKCVHAIRPIFV